VDAPVADGRRVDHRDQLGYLGLVLLEVLVRVLLREARTGEDDRVDLEALKHRRELFEQLRAAAGVLAPAGRPGDRRSLFGAVLGDRVDVGLTLLDSGDGDVGVFCRFLGLLESGLLIRFEPLLDRELVARPRR